MQKEYLSAAAEVLSDQGVDENLGLSTGEASSRPPPGPGNTPGRRCPAPRQDRP